MVTSFYNNKCKLKILLTSGDNYWMHWCRRN